MRPAKTIDEVNALLKELFEFKDTFERRDFSEINSVLSDLIQFKNIFTLKNVDWKKRRIVNASPSVDDYDYVVRKELIDTIGGATTPRSIITRAGAAANYDKATFGIGVGTPAAVGDYVTPPYVWSNNRVGRPSIILICANISPTGADLILDIKKNGSSIFTAGQVILPASTANRAVITYSGVFTTGLSFSRSDVLTPHVLQIGSTLEGQDINVVVFCPLI